MSSLHLQAFRGLDDVETWSGKFPIARKLAFLQRLQLRLGPLAPRRQIQMIRTLAGQRPQERIDFSLDVNHLMRLASFRSSSAIRLCLRQFDMIDV